jgi:hypothetical protein
MQPNTVIQIAPPHRWAGCLAIVDEVKDWGVQAYITMPVGDTVREAYVRLKWAELEVIGPAAFVQEVDNGV